MHLPAVKRSVIVAAGLLLVLIAALLFHYRLALTSDAALAARVRSRLVGVTGLPQVTAALSKQYEILSTAQGNQWHYRLNTVPSGSSVYFLIGEYRVVFVTSVVGLAVLDDSGNVISVEIRRDVDAL
jgi:uncharacterized membrane protein YdcZ (DUF606 family)